MPTETLMTTTQVAELAQVARSTVNRWAEDGTLVTAQRLPGGRRRFRPSDVEALLTPAGSDEVKP